jgi:hypothetical protein
MFTLGIVFGTQQQLAFAFKSEENAKKAFAVCTPTSPSDPVGEISSIIDDFGTTGTFRRGAITFAWIEDLRKVSDAAVERSLINARGQATLNQRANADPTLKVAALTQGNFGRMDGMIPRN